MYDNQKLLLGRKKLLYMIDNDNVVLRFVLEYNDDGEKYETV